MIYILRAQFHLVNCTMWRQVSKTIANNCQINYWQLREIDVVTYQLTRYLVREVSGDMLTCYLLPGSMSLCDQQPRAAALIAFCFFILCAWPYHPQILQCDPPKRLLSLAHSLASISREPAFTRPPTARYCKLLTALLTRLTAYSQLPHHRLHSPCHSFPPPVAP